MTDRYMTPDIRLREQMNNARFHNNKWERKGKNGFWEVWPILRMDRLGNETVRRILNEYARRKANPYE